MAKHLEMAQAIRFHMEVGAGFRDPLFLLLLLGEDAPILTSISFFRWSSKPPSIVKKHGGLNRKESKPE